MATKHQESFTVALGKDTSDLQALSYFQIHRKQSVTKLTNPSTTNGWLSHPLYKRTEEPLQPACEFEGTAYLWITQHQREKAKHLERKSGVLVVVPFETCTELLMKTALPLSCLLTEDNRVSFIVWPIWGLIYLNRRNHNVNKQHNISGQFDLVTQHTFN